MTAEADSPTQDMAPGTDPDWQEVDISTAWAQSIIRDGPGAWFETHGYVVGKDGTDELRNANWLQKRLFAIARWCLEHNKPCRLLIYKPRQKGCSTGTMALGYWWSRMARCKCLLMGGQYSQVENLWGIYSHYAATDTFDWGHSITVNTESAKLGNGSSWSWETANDPEAGRSGTYQVAICTEVARWAEEGVSNASKVLNGVQNCVPKLPGTLVVLETTVKGGYGEFYLKWVGDKKKNMPGAVTFEEFQRGKEGNGWIKVFAPWFMFDDSWLDARDQQEASDIMRGLGAFDEEELVREQELVRRYRLKAEQVKYWRDVLINECQRDPDNRDREYPTTPEDGFRSTLPGRFNRKGLLKLRIGAEAATARRMHAIIEEPTPGRYVMRPVETASEASYFIYEQPTTGYRYIMAADLCSGNSEEGTSDCHALLVLRLGYLSAQDGKWVPPKVVATCKYECRVSQDPALGEMAVRLSHFYGLCMVVPEANYDKGFIKYLRDRGIPLYEMERPATEKEDQKKTGKMGFWTSGGKSSELMRGFIIEQLAKAIREWDVAGSGIEIPAEHIVHELEYFVTKESGREEAAPGKHDDWVLALAIAFATREGATLYRPRQAPRPVPRDIELATGGGRNKKGRGAFRA